MLRLAVSLVCAVLLLALPPAPAVGDVFNGRIAFTSQRDGRDFDIFTVTPAGDDLRQLTVNDRNDHQTDWHPSGKTLAFRAEVTRQFQVWRMGPEGQDQTPLVALPATLGEASQPSWFPDQTGLLFRRSGSGLAAAVFQAGPGGENPELFFSFSRPQF